MNSSLQLLATVHISETEQKKYDCQAKKNQIKHQRFPFSLLVSPFVIQARHHAIHDPSSTYLIVGRRIESEYRCENQKVLTWHQPNHTRAHFTTSKEPSFSPPRVIPTMFKAKDRVTPFVRETIFERGRQSFDSLAGPESNGPRYPTRPPGELKYSTAR